MTEADSARDRGTPIAFRHFRGVEDYPILQSILLESSRLDQIAEPATLEDIEEMCAVSERFDPALDLLIAVHEDPETGEPADIAFSRVSWYTGPGDVRHYFQLTYLLPKWRNLGHLRGLVRQSDERLREKAASEPNPPEHSKLFAFARNTETELIEALELEGYDIVRRFHNMLHDLKEIPEHPLPEGLEVRPATPDHYRGIWEAQCEVNQELYEYIGERWTEERYQMWREDSSHSPDLWQVAWDGDQVAGMVLGRADEAEEKGRRRGYSEHIFVRKPWRHRGLATGLLSRCLIALKVAGMQEVELGVDSTNASGAAEFYKRMGYRTETIDTWYSKPLDG